jgi:YVTN family beta-propeller protein
MSDDQQKVVLDNSSSIVRGIAFDPTTNNLYVTAYFGLNYAYPGKIFVINTNDTHSLLELSRLFNNTRSIKASISVDGYPAGVAVNAKKNLVYVANPGSDLVYVINAITNKIIRNVTVGDQPWHIGVDSKTNIDICTEFWFWHSICNKRNHK